MIRGTTISGRHHKFNGRLVAFCLLSLSPCVGFAADEVLIDGKPLAKLLKQVQDKNRGLQVRAGRVLGNAKPEDYGRVIPQLIPLLRSDRQNTLPFIALALGKYGPPARAAVPDLLPLLEGTQYERNRTEAARALGLILKDAKEDEEVKKVVAALIKSFKDKYSDVRRESVRACGHIGPAARRCLDHITPLLKEHKLGVDKYEGYPVRLAAAWTVSRMGTHAKPLVDLMISLVHSDGNVNPHTVEALGSIGPVNENVAANITDKIESLGRPWDYMNFKIPAYRVLVGFGAKAKPAVAVVCRFLKPENRPHPKAVPLMLQIIKVTAEVSSAEDRKVALSIAQSFAHIKSHKGDQEQRATPEQLAEIHKAAQEAIKALGG